MEIASFRQREDLFVARVPVSEIVYPTQVLLPIAFPSLAHKALPLPLIVMAKEMVWSLARSEIDPCETIGARKGQNRVVAVGQQLMVYNSFQTHLFVLLCFVPPKYRPSLRQLCDLRGDTGCLCDDDVLHLRRCNTRSCLNMSCAFEEPWRVRFQNVTRVVMSSNLTRVTPLPCTRPASQC